MNRNLLNCGRRLLKITCGLALLVASFSTASAQVTVKASIDSTEILVGQQTKLNLEVSMNANEKLRLPALADTLVNGVEILEIAKPDTQLLNNDKRWVITQTYTLTSFDSALYYLPPLEILVNDKQYRSESLALKVYSFPVDTLHPDQFFGPKTIREVPLVWNDVSTMIYAFLLMLIFGAAAVFFIIRFINNKPIIKIVKIEPKLPPHQTAMKRIEEIKADKHVQRDDPKLYYTELTDVLRSYIEERFGFNAMEMTTSEIVEHLLEQKDKESIKDLKNLFETADLVKFAKHNPLMNENDMNLVNAVDFINETKLEEDPNAKKEPTEIKVEEKRSKQGRIMLMGSIVLASVASVVALYFAIRELINLFF